MAVFWLLLFVIIIIVSFLLAYQSMRDFQEGPRTSREEYGLFLIRSLPALDQKLLEDLHAQLRKKVATLSFERLTRGNQVALVVYGPKKLLQSFQGPLNLLELEDYAHQYQDNLTVFEVAKKDQTVPITGNIFQNLPKLESGEQFWWQIVLQPKINHQRKIFQGQARVGLLLDSSRLELASQFESLAKGELLKIPRPFSNIQMRQLFLERVVNFATVKKFTIPEVLVLLGQF